MYTVHVCCTCIVCTPLGSGICCGMLGLCRTWQFSEECWAAHTAPEQSSRTAHKRREDPQRERERERERGREREMEREREREGERWREMERESV